MGIAIGASEFSESDYQRFSERLHYNLDILKQLLQDPEFGGSQQSYGAELELYIVNSDCLVAPLNQAIQTHCNDPLLTLELNRFNLEYNLEPVANCDTPFTALQGQQENALLKINASAATVGARVVPVGILPTLKPGDFGPSCMTDLPRYHALTAGLKRLGSGDFKIHINGDPPLLMNRDDVTMEGANTSYQFHYRVQNKRFASLFNAFILATPAIVGLAANSPTLFGHRLWRETRVPLFKHSIDSRVSDTQWRQPARVSLGQGWARHSAYEIFAQTVAIHPPLLPVYGDEDYQSQLDRGDTPALKELSLHQNSVWPWLRPVYDANGSGHLRIELRALPAGPSNIDMLANAAFYIGVAEGLLENLDDLLPAMPFSYAKYNFYRAAQFGLDAKLVWPNRKRHQLQEISLPDLLAGLLPVARRGLEHIGIAGGEINRYLAVIEERLECRRSGADWQLRCMDALRTQGMTADQSASAMLEQYMTLERGGSPVAQWPLP